MIDYLITVGSILVATFIPAYFALFLFSSLRTVHVRYLAAAAVGLSFWYFYDTMKDATSIGADEAIYPIDQFGGYLHIALIATFIAGIFVLALFDHYAVPRPRTTGTTVTSRIGSRTVALVLIPIAVAAVSGIHGLGEGWNFASTAAMAPTQNLVDAFGTVAALASYPIHKFLEATIFAILYTIYVGRDDASKKRQWHIPMLGILFALPSVIGASIGYYTSVDTTYFFAFGVTSAIYAVLRLAAPISDKFTVEDDGVAYLGPRVFVSVLIGFFALYTAALLH